jgi:hypothetical protein
MAIRKKQQQNNSASRQKEQHVTEQVDDEPKQAGERPRDHGYHGDHGDRGTEKASVDAPETSQSEPCQENGTDSGQLQTETAGLAAAEAPQQFKDETQSKLSTESPKSATSQSTDERGKAAQKPSTRSRPTARQAKLASDKTTAAPENAPTESVKVNASNPLESSSLQSIATRPTQATKTVDQSEEDSPLTKPELLTKAAADNSEESESTKPQETTPTTPTKTDDTTPVTQTRSMLTLWNSQSDKGAFF